MKLLFDKASALPFISFFISLLFLTIQFPSKGQNVILQGSIDALKNNTSGSQNVAIGNSTLYSNTTGGGNFAIGALALSNNTTGEYNVALGYNALKTNITGSYTVAIGTDALFNNTTGYNTAIGYNSMLSTTTGTANVAIGYQSLKANTFGEANVAIGYSSMQANTIGSYNTAIGEEALQGGTGNNNIAVGYQSLYVNSDGSDNLAIGYTALVANTSGNENTAIGASLQSNTLGSGNISIGYNALNGNETGLSNLAIGNQAMIRSVAAGVSNLSIGDNSMADIAGSYNIGIGQSTLLGANANNIALGYYAGHSTTGSGNVFLGYRSGENYNGSNKLFIQNSNASIPLIYGDFSTGKVGLGTNAPTAKLDVQDTSTGTAAKFQTQTDGAIAEFTRLAGSGTEKISYTKYNAVDNAGLNSTPVYIGGSADYKTGIFQPGLAIFWDAGPPSQANTPKIICTPDINGMQFDCDLLIKRGNKIKITEGGANAAMNIATLVAGTVTVNTTIVTANSRIILTNNNPNGGPVGTPYISARVPGTSFTISSTNGADVSDIIWVIVEPN